MGKNLSKSVKILVSEQTARAALLYFRQVFVFCRLIINKNVLEWFLLIMCEEHTRTELFLFKKRRSADGQYGTATFSNWQKQPLEVFHKKAAFISFAKLTGKYLC